MNGNTRLSRPSRRRVLAALGTVAGAAMLAPVAALAGQTSIAGAMPDLEFTMTRASDGQVVTAADYRDRVVLIYFGFTHCPDICPLTLANLTRALEGMDAASADRVSVLFVTVDLGRDDLDILDRYQAAFAPQVDALRGTANQMTALAKRYRVAHSVREVDGEIVVSHGSAVYAFDREGHARQLLTGLSDGAADVTALRADLQALVDGRSADRGWLFGLL